MRCTCWFFLGPERPRSDDDWVGLAAAGVDVPSVYLTSLFGWKVPVATVKVGATVCGVGVYPADSRGA